MNLYLAAPFTWRPDVADLAERIEAAGHSVTSSWLWSGIQEARDAAPPERAKWAVRDLEEIRGSEALVVFTRRPGSEPGGMAEICRAGTGGKDFEAAWALAHQKLLIVCGPAVCIFYDLWARWPRNVFQVEDETELLQWLEARANA